MKIADLSIGKVYDLTLVVKSATARETKAKKPYLAIEFYDGTDTINGNYWDWFSGNIPEPSSIVDVNAQVTEWAGNMQLNVRSMKLNTQANLAEFMPTSTYDIAQTYRDAYALMSSVNDNTLRAIALGLLEELQHSWLTVPGAVSVHHAFVGGTLVHSYNVAKIADNIAAAMPDANRDMCIVGAMLHDVGKLFTYKMNGITIDMTEVGNMYDHIFIGAELVGNFSDTLHLQDDVWSEHKIQLLRHIILSHHGKLEYGSPVTPKCIEAIIVSAADGIDSSAEQIRDASRKVPAGTGWTEKIYTLNNKPHLTPSAVAHVMGGCRE